MTTKKNFSDKLGLALILTLLCSQTIAQKVMKTYHDYLNLKLKEEWQIDKDGFKNGYYKSYFENKMPFEVGQYKNDFKNGIWKEFEADGKLRVSEIYKDGKNDGLSQIWENGMGFHRLTKETYYDSYGAYRETNYYPNGVVQSDIRRDGECKLFYDKDKLAKVWQNQNAKPIASSIKIWTNAGEPFTLQKIINGVAYKIDSDVEFDWSGDKSGKIAYYITPPTAYTADSAGWKISVSGGEYRYASTLPDDQANGVSLKPAGYVYNIEKEKVDTIIEMTYLSNEPDGNNLLLDLKFLNNSKTYLSELLKYISKPSSSVKATTKIIYNIKGEIIKKQIGSSELNYSTDKYIFTVKNESTPSRTFGTVSVSFTDDASSGDNGKISGSINGSNYTFQYDKNNYSLILFKNEKKYLTATISLVNLIPESVRDNWISAQSSNLKSDNDLGKCLELLDNSPQSFFYYSSDLQLFSENDQVVASLKNEKSSGAYSYSSESLEYKPILKIYKSESTNLYVQIKPDNKQIIDQLNLLSLLSSHITFNLQQTKGFLRNPNMDFGKELLAFATTYKQ